MVFLELAQNRYSVRAYQQKAVEQEKRHRPYALASATLVCN